MPCCMHVDKAVIFARETKEKFSPKRKYTTHSHTHRKYQIPGAARTMGDCFSACLGGGDHDDDPLLNAEARRRAAEAAQARQEAFAQSAAGKRQAKAAARDKAANNSNYSNAQHEQRIADIMS